MQGSGPREEAGAGREEEPGVSLWAFFDAACYRGFGDDSGGFYRVYAARPDEPPADPDPNPRRRTRSVAYSEPGPHMFMHMCLCMQVRCDLR